MSATHQEKISNGFAWPKNNDGCRVPYRVFTDQEFYDLEQERIFRGDNWSFVGLEAEVSNPGDFKATYVGDTPVIVTRDLEGGINVLKNLCAHRGALVCRTPRGSVQNLECVYHQWAYSLKGDLLGVPFRRGIRGQGGMPDCFDMKEHGLDRLHVETLNGMIFATFSEKVAPLREYLGPMAVAAIERIFNRPVKVLGDQRQFIHGNWKLYAENTRDPYHASLLHLFHTTFGLYRSSQTGVSKMDAKGRHSMLTAKSASNDAEQDKEIYKDMRTFNADFVLQDPSLLAGRPEFKDGVTLVILALFPNVVVQQIANTLAVRQIVTYGPKGFELVWTQFGYADEDAEMTAIRLKQGNLIGPAGLISMEDGEAVEIVHDAIVRDQDKTSYIAMGGGKAEDAEHLVTEGAIIGFWENYQRALGFAASA